jgi:hypothetical protein
MSKNNRFESLALSDLNMVIGGAKVAGEVETPAVKVKGTYEGDPSPPPAAPDPDKQLRCYKQFADQAHWYDNSNTTFNHQLLACGPLRP